MRSPVFFDAASISSALRLFRSGGTFDLFKPAILCKLKRISHAQRFRQHAELDGPFDRQSAFAFQKWCTKRRAGK